MIEKEIVLNKYMDEKKKSQRQKIPNTKNPKHKRSQTRPSVCHRRDSFSAYSLLNSGHDGQVGHLRLRRSDLCRGSSRVVDRLLRQIGVLFLLSRLSEGIESGGAVIDAGNEGAPSGGSDQRRNGHGSSPVVDVGFDGADQGSHFHDLLFFLKKNVLNKLK